jgi:hypothetical protein
MAHVCRTLYRLLARCAHVSLPLYSQLPCHNHRLYCVCTMSLRIVWLHSHLLAEMAEHVAHFFARWLAACSNTKNIEVCDIGVSLQGYDFWTFSIILNLIKNDVCRLECHCVGCYNTASPCPQITVILEFKLYRLSNTISNNSRR